MTKECELLETCGFFKKYGQSNELACKGFVMTYCKGDKMDRCERKKYREKHGVPPDDEMMPNGAAMVE